MAKAARGKKLFTLGTQPTCLFIELVQAQFFFNGGLLECPVVNCENN